MTRGGATTAPTRRPAARTRREIMAKTKTDGPPMPLPPGVPPDGPAVAAADEKAAPPRFGTARPAGDGVLPRVIDPLERAAPGTVRVKVACRNYTPRPVRYVLARGGERAEADARECYLESTGLGRELARLRKVAGANAAEVEEPDLVLTVLPD